MAFHHMAMHLSNLRQPFYRISHFIFTPRTLRNGIENVEDPVIKSIHSDTCQITGRMLWFLNQVFYQFIFDHIPGICNGGTGSLHTPYSDGFPRFKGLIRKVPSGFDIVVVQDGCDPAFNALNASHQICIIDVFRLHHNGHRLNGVWPPV